MPSSDDQLTGPRSGGSQRPALSSRLVRQVRQVRVGVYSWLEGIRFRTGIVLLAASFAIVGGVTAAMLLTAHGGPARHTLAGQEPPTGSPGRAGSPAQSAPSARTGVTRTGASQADDPRGSTGRGSTGRDSTARTGTTRTSANKTGKGTVGSVPTGTAG